MSKKQDSGGAVLTVEQLRTRQETHHLSVAASLFALYLLTGSLYFTLNGEALSFVDALYFLIVSFTTVGYGDIIATGTEAKAIICLLILLGIITMGYFGSIFSDSVANKLQRQAVKRDKRIVAFLAGVGKARNTAIEKAMSKTGVFRYFLKRLGRLAVLARSGLEKARRIWSSQANVDNSACLNNGTDSNSDLISVLDVPIATVGDIRQMNIHSYDYEYQKANAKAVYSILCIMSMLLLGAVVMTSIEKWSFVDALYWAIVTSTTVGYGDKTPTSVGGRAFCIVYILVGTFIIAQAMAVFIHYPLLRRQRKQEFEVLEQFLNLPAETLSALSVSIQEGSYTFLRQTGQNSNAATNGINKAEFVILLLEMMNKLPKQDVMLASRVFDSLDKAKIGVLSSDMLNKEAQRVVEREESVAAERVRTRGNSIFTAPVFSPLSMVQNDDSDGV